MVEVVAYDTLFNIVQRVLVVNKRIVRLIWFTSSWQADCRLDTDLYDLLVVRKRIANSILIVVYNDTTVFIQRVCHWAMT